MIGVEAWNVHRDSVLGDSIREASTWWSRLRGLLGTDALPEGNGLWIHPCTGIHSIGMRYEIDVLFLDPKMRVVGLYSRFPRNRISRIFRNALGVLELPGGMIERTGTEVGDEIAFRT